MQPTKIFQIVFSGESLVQAVMLEQGARALANRVGLLDNVVTQHVGSPTGWSREAEKEVERGRLPGTVGAKVAKDAAARNVEREAIKGP
jgi:hypothetical protein